MIVGEAEIAVLADTGPFATQTRAALETNLAAMSGDVEAAGASMAAPLAAGGRRAGEEAGQETRAGLKTGLAAAETDAATTGESMAGSLTGKLKTGLQGLASVFTGGLVPMQTLGTAADKAAGSMDHVNTSGKGAMGTFQTLGGATLLGATAGLVAFGAAGVKMAMDQQKAVADLASSAGISVKAANNIGSAFVATMGTTIYSGTQITQAYTSVAAQLGSVEGHALTASQAMSVMKAAMDLAEATGQSLGSTTSDLGKIMQTFQIPTGDAAKAADALFQSARQTGAGLDATTAAMMKMRSTMGVTSPNIDQMGALMIDLANHGETGRKALAAMNSATSALLKPTTDLAGAQLAQQNAMKALPPTLDNIAKAYQAGTATAAQVSAATKGLTADQAAQWKTFASATDSVQKYSTNLSNAGITVTNAHGSFVGFGSIIDQLQPKLQGLTQAQQLAYLQTVFGASANKTLLETIMAGPAAFDASTKSVEASGSAHAAAEKQSATLARQFDVMKATVIDLATQFGSVLIPKIEGLLKVVAESIHWLEQHKAVAEALALVIGGVLSAAVAAFAVDKVAKFVGGIQKMASAIGDTVAKMIGGAATMEATETELAATSEETGAATSAAFGPIGIAVMALAALAPLIISHWKDLTHWLIDAWNAIKNAAVSIWDFIKDHIRVIITVIVGVVTGPIGLLVLYLATHWHQVLSDVTRIWGDIVAFFTAIPGRVLGALEALVGFVAHIASDAWNTFVQINTTMANAVIGFFTGLPGRILSGLARLVGDIGRWIGDVWNAWVSIDTAMVGAVIGFFEGLPGRILGALASLGGDLAGLAGRVISGMAQAFVDGVGAVTSFFSGLWGRISTAIGSWFDDAYHIAGRLIDGLVGGITDGVGKITGAIGKMADKVKSFFSSVFSIFSPSKVFYGYGDNLMQGLANGIEDKGDAALASLGKVAQKMKTVPFSAPPLPGMGAGGASTAAGAMGHQETHVTVQVSAGAVSITAPEGTSPDNLQPLADAVNEGFVTLAREIGAGVTPLRGNG